MPGARTFHRRGRHFVCWSDEASAESVLRGGHFELTHYLGDRAAKLASARIARLNSSTQTAVVCDTTAYLPCELVERTRNRLGQPLRLGRRAAGARARHLRLRRLLPATALLRGRRHHLAAVDRRLPRRLRAPARGRQGDRLDPHLRGHLRNLRGRQSGAPAADRRRQERRADPRHGLALGGRGDGPDRARRRRRRSLQGGDSDRGAGPRRADARRR